MSATVFEEGEGPGATLCAVGVSLIVDDDVVQWLKTPPLGWIGPELARCVVLGVLPLLTGKRLRELNSRGGLNLVVWEGCIRPEFEERGEAHRALITSFIAQHRGFLWKEIIGSQAANGARLEWTIRSGALLWNPTAAQYTDLSGLDPEEIARKPHIIGLTRSIEATRGGSWVGSWIGSLFDYCAPRLGFGGAEQRLLLAALRGESTDEELSDALGVTLATVKKTWLSIYDRTTNGAAPILRCYSGEGPFGARGREKRRRLLAYLREHPQELRPHLPKLLCAASRLGSSALEGSALE
ncbi:MAG TPA: hypothetical protein VEV18_00785 [Steroidobacteraceae bacterium]|nr:hypothetical protein [Steroidobacteraceae bacterium]